MLVYEDDFNRTVRVYYNELKRYKPISKAAERRLIRLAKKGNEKAKNELVESNLRFVFDLAKKYANKGVPISELISEGNVALFKAIDKFDSDKDVKFITYAVWWIRQAMTEMIRKNKVMKEFEGSNDNDTTSNTQSNIYDNEDDNEYIANELSDYIDERKRECEKNQEQMVNDLMDGLNDKEKDIIESYYGINGKKEETLMEIGKRYNLTCERVRQLKRNVIKRMKCEALSAYDTEDLFV